MSSDRLEGSRVDSEEARRRLLGEYGKRRREIRSRLQYFKSRQRESETELFSELCFCLFTPQSRAEVCDRAVQAIKGSGLLSKGTRAEVASRMRGVRFKNQKAGFLVEARKMLADGGEGLRAKVGRPAGNKEIRRWLVENVKGLGYKEASHFLRNIGMGKDLAILDRHILKNLLLCRVIDEIPASLTKKRYLEIEEKMLEFSSEIGIPMEELDLLFWSMETGKVFK